MRPSLPRVRPVSTWGRRAGAREGAGGRGYAAAAAALGAAGSRQPCQHPARQEANKLGQPDSQAASQTASRTLDALARAAPRPLLTCGRQRYSERARSPRFCGRSLPMRRPDQMLMSPSRVGSMITGRSTWEGGAGQSVLGWGGRGGPGGGGGHSALACGCKPRSAR
jgi:hypothetical protein